MNRIVLSTLSALILTTGLSATAAAQRGHGDLRENAEYDADREAQGDLNSRNEDGAQEVREELEVIEDDRQAPGGDDAPDEIRDLCAAYEEGTDESFECWEVFAGMDSNGDGRIAPGELTTSYGDILINGEPIDIE